MVNSSYELDVERFKIMEEDYKDAEFILDENGKYIVGHK
jgi:leucyl-tRNA synthetase